MAQVSLCFVLPGPSSITDLHVPHHPSAEFLPSLSTLFSIPSLSLLLCFSSSPPGINTSDVNPSLHLDSTSSQSQQLPQDEN